MDSGQLTLYRGCTPVVDAEYGEASDRTPVEAIIDAVAEAAATDPLALSPLHDTIDADAIDRLFAQHDGAAEAEALLSFRFETWNVFVRADGRIRVCDATRPTDPEPVFETGVP